MKILIIEDETEAAKNLMWLLKNIEPQAEIVGILETVSEGITWLETQPHPDLIISDIQLADGNSFEIYKHIKPKCAVIFATAFDEYAIQAFEVNSIDYLLKPINQQSLNKAIEKYKSLKINWMPDKLSDMMQLLQQPKTYRKSFLVRFRDKMLPLKIEAFSFFYIKEGLVYGKTFDDNQYIIEEKLEDLETQLTPAQFFRANRQYIVSRDAIQAVDFYFNGRLSLKTHPLASEHILISKERIPVFKKWFEAV
jgi:two-component system, LytTR family, response regulator LytT